MMISLFGGPFVKCPFGCCFSLFPLRLLNCGPKPSLPSSSRTEKSRLRRGANDKCLARSLALLY